MRETILNAIGLSISFFGTVLMFFANPKVNPPSIFLPNGEDLLEYKKTDKRTKKFRLGMGLVSIGFLIQAVSLILSLFDSK